jgi:hypothetical protein
MASSGAAPLFANKLLIRTVESASVDKGWRQNIRLSCRRRGKASILAGHCLHVTTGLTCSGCCIYGRRCEGHGIYSLSGLSENFGCERRANQ